LQQREGNIKIQGEELISGLSSIQELIPILFFLVGLLSVIIRKRIEAVVLRINIIAREKTCIALLCTFRKHREYNVFNQIATSTLNDNPTNKVI